MRAVDTVTLTTRSNARNQFRSSKGHFDVAIAFAGPAATDRVVTRTCNWRTPQAHVGTPDNFGECRFQYRRKNSAARFQFQTDNGTSIGNPAEIDVIHLSAVTSVILPADVRRGVFDRIDEYRNAGGEPSFTSNCRPKLWQVETAARDTVEATWQRCNKTLPRADDDLALFGEQSAPDTAQAPTMLTIRPPSHSRVLR